MGRLVQRPGRPRKWVGDFQQIHTREGPVFLGTVEDLFSTRAARSSRPRGRPGSPPAAQRPPDIDSAAADFSPTATLRCETRRSPPRERPA